MKKILFAIFGMVLLASLTFSCQPEGVGTMDDYMGTLIIQDTSESVTYNINITGTTSSDCGNIHPGEERSFMLYRGNYTINLNDGNGNGMAQGISIDPGQKITIAY